MKQDRIVGIDRNYLALIYDRAVRFLNIVDGEMFEVELPNRDSLLNSIYSKVEELRDDQLKLVEDIPFLRTGTPRRLTDRNYISMVRELEAEISDTYGIPHAKVSKKYYSIFSIHKHIWIEYQQGLVLPISIAKGAKMLFHKHQNQIKHICYGDDDLFCAYLATLNKIKVKKLMVADIDKILLRFYKNVVVPYTNENIVTVCADFNKERVIPNAEKHTTAYTNPPTRIELMQKFIKLTYQPHRHTLVATSSPKTLFSIINPHGVIEKLAPLSVFSLRIFPSESHIVIDTTHVAPYLAVIKWR